SLALGDDGTVWGWGQNLVGQVGDGTTALSRPSPVHVSGLTGMRMIAVAAGGGLVVRKFPGPAPSYSDFSLALRDDGTAWGCGAAGMPLRARRRSSSRCTWRA